MRLQEKGCWLKSVMCLAAIPRVASFSVILHSISYCLPATAHSTMPEPNQHWKFSIRQLLAVTAHIAIFLGFTTSLGIPGFSYWLCLFITWRLEFGTERTELRVIQVLVAYGLLSIVTLPLMDTWWIGELPVLALPQAPKTEAASEIRHTMVMHLMGPLGLSRGSFSPDWTLARPYALAVVYLVPLAIWISMITHRTRLRRPHRNWAIAVVVVAIVDYVMTLNFAGGPGLSIY